jgi:hypothetical protein
MWATPTLCPYLLPPAQERTGTGAPCPGTGPSARSTAGGRRTPPSSRPDTQRTSALAARAGTELYALLCGCGTRRLDAAVRISRELVFRRDGPQLLIAPVASEEQGAWQVLHDESPPSRVRALKRCCRAKRPPAHGAARRPRRSSRLGEPVIGTRQVHIRTRLVTTAPQVGSGGRCVESCTRSDPDSTHRPRVSRRLPSKRSLGGARGRLQARRPMFPVPARLKPAPAENASAAGAPVTWRPRRSRRR